MLLLTASGLRQRLDGAWYLSVAALVVGIVASLLKGFDWEEAILVSVVLVTLLPARRFFYRRSRLRPRCSPRAGSPRWSPCCSARCC
ncbi:MAG: hypothetical protein V9E87_02920 [Gemmatimonadales bacterium]